MVKKKVAHAHNNGEQQGKKHIGGNSLLEGASGFEFASLSEKRTYQWGKPIAVTHEQERNEVEHTVDKRGGSQRIGSVAAYHHEHGYSSLFVVSR